MSEGQVQIVKITERSCAVIGNWIPYVTVMVKHKGKYKNEMSVLLKINEDPIVCDGWIFPRDLKQQLETEINSFVHTHPPRAIPTSSTIQIATPSLSSIPVVMSINPAISRKDLQLRVSALEDLVQELQQQVQQLWIVKRS